MAANSVTSLTSDSDRRNIAANIVTSLTINSYEMNFAVDIVVLNTINIENRYITTNIFTHHAIGVVVLRDVISIFVCASIC